MSVRALTWSFSLELRDVAAKSALHALADHADETGYCWPSMGRVARWMGSSESTARRAVHKLVRLGIVLCEQTQGGAGITNKFTLNFDWQPPQGEPVQDGTLADCNPVNLTKNPVRLRNNPVNVHQNPVTLTPEPSRTVIKPSENHQAEREAFDAYNAACEGMIWSKAQRWNDKRRRALTLRLRECGGIDGWNIALAKARASPFVRKSGWFSLDWLLKPANFTKLFEGNYDDKSSPDEATGLTAALAGVASAPG